MAGTGSGLPIETLVVPLDGSERSARAVVAVARLASRLGARVHLVSVAANQDEADVRRGQFEAVAAEVPNATREVIMTDDAVPTVDTVARAVTEVARSIGGVVCLGSHGRGRSAAVLGSVAVELTAQSDRPTVIVGPAFDPGTWATDAPVVACVDGTARSEAVVPVALEWARTLATPLSIVTVAEPIPAPVPGRSWRRMHGPDEEAGRYLAALADRYLDSGVPVDVAVAYDPVSVAVGLTGHLAHEPASLVAVATRARTRLPRLVLGSNAASILREVPVPVLAVPLPHEA